MTYLRHSVGAESKGTKSLNLVLWFCLLLIVRRDGL